MLFKKKRAESADQPLIVVIDDEPDLCQCIRLGLEEHGIEVATAHDGIDGLTLVRRRRPSLIMLDIMMPRLNGYQVLAELQQDAELSRIPIIVMTSLSEEGKHDDEEWARRLAVRHFVSKPFNPETVAHMVLRELSMA